MTRGDVILSLQIAVAMMEAISSHSSSSRSALRRQCRNVTDLINSHRCLPKSSSGIYKAVREIFLNRMGYVADLAGGMESKHNGCVNTINFNPNGELIVTGSDDTTLKIWRTDTQKCQATLHGHASNVFASSFLPHKSDRGLLSGSNDSDVRYFDLEAGTCTVYQHHWKKVLKLTVNPQMPDCFLSCSADGTVRLFDLRMHYHGSVSQRTASEGSELPEDDFVLPQAFGGGRASSLRARRSSSNSSSASSESLHFQNDNNFGANVNRLPADSSLLIDYSLAAVELGTGAPMALYSVDFHPFNGLTFIVGSMDGNVRLFDLRKIDRRLPTSHVNIFTNYGRHERPGGFECTGCAWSRDGTEICASMLSDLVYVFDVNRNFKKEFQLDYAPWRTRQKRRLRFLRKRAEALLELKKENEKGQEKEVRESSPSSAHADGYTITIRPPADMLLELVRRYPQYREHLLDGAFDPEEMALCLDGIITIEMLLSSQNSEDDAEDEDVDEEELEGEEDEGSEEDGNGNDSDRHNEDEEDVGDDDAFELVNYDYDSDPNDDTGKTPRKYRELQTYKSSYEGHVSFNTVKGVSFFGADSEYIVSGSDDSRVFIWDKKTAKVVQILEGHDDIVNCVVEHPHLPILATSGIDDEAKLWAPLGGELSARALNARKKKWEQIITVNNSRRSFEDGDV